MIDRIASTFRASIYLLLTLSVCSIGLAEGNIFPHLLTLPILGVAYFYLDERPILRIESFATSLLGLAALVVAIVEFQQGRINVEMRILSASHLLAYFTWIVLIIHKENQQYWWMIALSILNMAVSASLTTSSALGLAVLVYLFLAVWTLALFTAYRGTAHLRSERRPAPPQQSASAAVGATVSSPRKPTLPAASLQELQTHSSKVRGGFHFDPTDNWLGHRLIGSVLFLSFASLIVGMAIFMGTPRVWIGNWQLPSSAEEGIAGINFGKKVSGFTSEVRLGDMGEILDNPTPVMRVHFFDQASGNPMTSEQVISRFGYEDLLFRGTVLSRYQQGRWSEDHPEQPQEDLPSSTAPRTNRAVRFQYELEPVGRSTLFVVNPIDYGVLLSNQEVYRRLERNSFSQEVVLPQHPNYDSMFTIRYETVGRPPQAEQQSLGSMDLELTEKEEWRNVFRTISQSIEAEYQLEPNDLIEGNTDLSNIRLGHRKFPLVHKFDTYFRSLLVLDTERMERLIELSKELCQREGQVLSPRERCLALHNYLRHSGEFGYTLNMSITDPTIDPVEDFVFNRKSGHCEYFASALTLMLRAVGVPARMVSGFKGGRWDERNQRLSVEQRHAHAWVEALVDGRWMVLDPTTARDVVEDSTLTKVGLSWAALRGYLSSYWQNNVLSVSLSKQRDSIYEPMKAQTVAFTKWVGEVKNNLTGKNDRTGSRQSRFHNYLFYFTMFFFFLIIVTVVVAYLYFRNSLSFLGWKYSGRRAMTKQQQMVLFFRQFLDLAARNGLRKAPDQTAREFALLFTIRFQEQLSALSLETLPMMLTNAYYIARFRGDELDESEVLEWRTQIEHLEKALTVQRS